MACEKIPDGNNQAVRLPKEMGLYKSMFMEEFNAMKRAAYWYVFSVIASVEIILAFSSIGYFTISPVSLTLMPVPVLLGSVLFGPVGGMLLGGVFGLTSMWKATSTAVTYADMIFSPFISDAPLSSLVLCMGCRMLFGFCAGILFVIARRSRTWRRTALASSALIAVWLHSVLVYAAMQVLFPDAGLTLNIILFQKLTTLNSLMNWGLSVVLVILLYMIGENGAMKFFRHKFHYMEQLRRNNQAQILFVCFFALLIVLALSLFNHFYGRVEMALLRDGIVMEQALAWRFLQIGLQFMAALFALIYLISLAILMLAAHSREMKLKSERDPLTGLYNRMFVAEHVSCGSAAKTEGASQVFIMLDIDRFKLINDMYGHPFGDEILKSVARILQECFRKEDAIARLGGDEFAVYMERGCTRRRVEEAVAAVCNEVRRLAAPAGEDGGFSCSIGVAILGPACGYEHLYAKADAALYQTKQRGRNGYTVYEE